MPLEEKNFYEFGSFRLEPSERLLSRAGESVSLPPKAFETLLLLVRNSGHVLSKDELMRKLWPDTFVEENNLTQHISLLRRALGETQTGDRYIETVPRMGYRFAMPVREVADNADSEVWLERRTRTHILVREQEEVETTEGDASEERAASATGEPLRKIMKRTALQWMAVAAVTTVICAAAYFLVGRSRTPARPVNPPPTLAVLPFRDLKPDAGTQFLSYSLADAIIHRLGYFNEIVVRPSSYVAKYRGGEADPRSVAQELHAEAVLTGNFFREGDRLQVSAELVDVAKGEVLWHDRWEVPYGQLLTIQDRVAENVVRGLRLQILPQTETRLKQSAPRNPLAYEYYLRGRNSGAPNKYLLSMQMLEKSVELDPSYAPAWMELGSAYAGHATWEGGGAAFEEKSQSAFRRALELDPDLPEVHALLAIQMVEHADVEKGLLTLREELHLHSNVAMAHWWLAEAYLYGGMLEDSIAEGNRALELDPLVNTGSTFNTYLHAGDYQKFLSTMPRGESARTTFYRGLCYFYMRDTSRAAAEFERAYALDPSLLHAKYGKAFLYAIRNQTGEGRKYLKELEEASPTSDGEMLYKMAQVYATLGDTPSALRLMEQAIHRNFYCHDCFLRDPLTVSLHGEARYAELMSLARARSEEFRRKYF
jgi:DNA-binding winged helix-turn-helix (wHTH) protein/TolB-like protein/Tfp pilus assembly protein PilF